MDYLSALILGVIEGLTEFLPISSTGHLILASRLLGIEQTEFHKTFEIFIQFGAILAVVATYWRSLLDMEVIKRLLVAFIPTGIIGFTLYKFIKGSLIGNEVVVVWALLLGGVALIAFELLHTEKALPVDGQRPREGGDDLRSVTYGQALFIGLFQSIAIVPGVSRAAASIVGGLLAGLRRATVVQFSFLLAVPTMAAASGYDLLKTSPSFSSEQFGLLAVGFLASFAVALVAIRFLLRYVRRHNFIPFGIYRIVLALVFLVFVIGVY
jgi:undecaprenyl-diphosphatase